MCFTSKAFLQNRKPLLETSFGMDFARLALGQPMLNLVSLCGGTCPEILHLHEMGAPVAKVFLVDTDLQAVGVALSNAPESTKIVVLMKVTRNGLKKSKKFSWRTGNIEWLLHPALLNEMTKAFPIHAVQSSTPCDDLSAAKTTSKNGKLASKKESR